MGRNEGPVDSVGRTDFGKRGRGQPHSKTCRMFERATIPRGFGLGLSSAAFIAIGIRTLRRVRSKPCGSAVSMPRPESIELPYCPAGAGF